MKGPTSLFVWAALLSATARSFSVEPAWVTSARNRGRGGAVTTRGAATRGAPEGDGAGGLRRSILQSVVSGVLAAPWVLTQSAQASEIGVEVEAPTLYTGETVMICKKRGPLGACLETVVRTEENDNDKAKKYLSTSRQLMKKELSGIEESEMSEEGRALVERLRQQSKDNAERNRLEIERKTFENDQGAITGPFSRQVLIMNTDEKTFTLLDNPQAMRLKDAGFIKDRKFVKQPTQEELESYAAPPDGGSILDGIRGMLGGSEE